MIQVGITTRIFSSGLDIKGTHQIIGSIEGAIQEIQINTRIHYLNQRMIIKPIKFLYTRMNILVRHMRC